MPISRGHSKQWVKQVASEWRRSLIRRNIRSKCWIFTALPWPSHLQALPRQRTFEEGRREKPSGQRSPSRPGESYGIEDPNSLVDKTIAVLRVHAGHSTCSNGAAAPNRTE